MNNLKFPCSIGDFAYTIDIRTDEIKVYKEEVEGFIVDKSGIYPAIMTHDGWECIGFYTSHKTVYYTEEEALKQKALLEKVLK